MHSWMFVWMFVMFMFLVPPVGYGWGYRGWGPPYPRYVQRRRGEQAQAPAPGTEGSFDHHAWGWGGDVVWTVIVFGAMWAVMGLLWR